MDVLFNDNSSGVVTASASKDVLSKLLGVDNEAFPKVL